MNYTFKQYLWMYLDWQSSWQNSQKLMSSHGISISKLDVQRGNFVDIDLWTESLYVCENIGKLAPVGYFDSSFFILGCEVL